MLIYSFKGCSGEDKVCCQSFLIDPNHRFLYYILMTVLSLVLFYLPIFREPDSHVSFVDMLFMAISTVSVTGLSTFDINSVFNDNGIILLEILFQVGGLGIMMISTAFVIFF
ncbi:hypothetical protein NWO25_06290 [Enterococcus lactis]|nr:hypothetical protein [Enterococcus lactis]